MRNRTPDVSQEVREEAFIRDGSKCALCDATEDLYPHRITTKNLMPGGGDVPRNVITLCPSHRKQAKVFYETKGDEFVEGMRPEDLYARISSSWREAMLDSKVGWDVLYKSDADDF